MIKYAIALLFSFSVLSAQDTVNQIATDVHVGDVYEIGEPATITFKHIDFPRANFIIKRGGIANYKSVVGNKVVIASVKEKRDGTSQVKIKRKDGGRFFGSHTVVAVDFAEAVKAGELHSR